MAVDNQVLLATILVVGLGYYFLKMKPGQTQITENERREIQIQNINHQVDQVEGIFDEFKIDWGKRGNNAETTPITPEEWALLEGLENNLKRVDKEAGRTRAFNRSEQSEFMKRRDHIFSEIQKYKSKFNKTVLQEANNARAQEMDLGEVVGPREHIGKFNKAAPKRTAAQVLLGVSHAPSDQLLV